jgi:RimJ/RimL family protein N-acetyltransferase
MNTVPFTLPRCVRLKDGRQVVIDRSVENDAAELLEFLPLTHRESDFLGYLAGEFNFTIEQEQEFIRLPTTLPNTLLLVARDNGRIVATAGAIGSKFKRAAHQTELGITVAGAYRGVGLGRHLMECMIDWAEDRQLRKLTLRVFTDNHGAIALYRSLGFVQEGLLRGDALRADGAYGDTLVMAKFLKPQNGPASRLPDEEARDV